MPASATTLAHFALSLRMNWPNASGVPGFGSAPSVRSFSAIAGSVMTLTNAALSLATISGGVPAALTSPNQPTDS